MREWPRGVPMEYALCLREKFTQAEDRGVFGSVVRDWRGNWEIMLTRRSVEWVWVQLAQGAPFDDERPSGGM